VEAAAEAELVITNSLYEVTLSNRGGRARSWKLHAYTTSDGRPLELIPPYVEQSEYFLAVDLDTPELTAALHEALYTVERERLFADGDRGPGEKVTFTWRLNPSPSEMAYIWSKSIWRSGTGAGGCRPGSRWDRASLRRMRARGAAGTPITARLSGTSEAMSHGCRNGSWKRRMRSTASSAGEASRINTSRRSSCPPKLLAGLHGAASS